MKGHSCCVVESVSWWRGHLFFLVAFLLLVLALPFWDVVQLVRTRHVLLEIQIARRMRSHILSSSSKPEYVLHGQQVTVVRIVRHPILTALAILGGQPFQAAPLTSKNNPLFNSEIRLFQPSEQQPEWLLLLTRVVKEALDLVGAPKIWSRVHCLLSSAMANTSNVHCKRSTLAPPYKDDSQKHWEPFVMIYICDS